jgi:hypothetical protein
MAVIAVIADVAVIGNSRQPDVSPKAITCRSYESQ